MSFVHVAVVVGLTAVLAQVWLNLRVFPALVTAPMPGMSRARPRLSVLIPARNESVNIARCVAAWLSQTIMPTELLVLDDESGDDTLERARAAVARVSWAAALTGVPKPGGWTGKTFACHQLAQAARGDVLVFADADIVPEPGTLEALSDLFSAPATDAVSVLPRHTASSRLGRHVAPLQTWVLICFCPLWLGIKRPRGILAAANGQLFAVRRRAYDSAGGHRSVRRSLAEDTALARRLAAAGFRTRFVDGSTLVTGASYDTFPEIWFGNIKNLFPILFCSRVLVALAVAGLVAGFVAPWLLLAAAVGHGPFALIIAVVEIALGLSSRLVISLRFRYAVVDTWSHPLIVLLLCVLLVSSAWTYRRGSVHWRGREYGGEIT